MLKISSFEVVGIQIISVSTVNFSIIDGMKMNFIIGLKLHADDRKKNSNLSLIYPCVSFNCSDKT